MEHKRQQWKKKSKKHMTQKTRSQRWVWGYTPVIPVLGRKGRKEMFQS